MIPKDTKGVLKSRAPGTLLILGFQKRAMASCSGGVLRRNYGGVAVNF